MHRAVQTIVGLFLGCTLGLALGFASQLLLGYEDGQGFWRSVDGFFAAAGWGLGLGSVVGAGILFWQTRDLPEETTRSLHERGVRLWPRPTRVGGGLAIGLAVAFVGILVYTLILPTFRWANAGNNRMGLAVFTIAIALIGAAALYFGTRFLATRSPPDDQRGPKPQRRRTSTEAR
ncbi:MAG: hypothetical protein ACI9MR_004827 [Myxococcota bacterium]|jgi:hypothetical protein